MYKQIDNTFTKMTMLMDIKLEYDFVILILYNLNFLVKSYLKVLGIMIKHFIEI